MRSSIGLLLVLIAFTFTTTFASANETQQVLADILSPDELAEEMGIAEDASDFLADRVFSDIEPRLHIKIDKSLEGTSPTAQSMEVYLDGVLIHTALVSTGREKDELAKSGKKYFSSTPTGTFKITRRRKDYFSKTWQAPMPFAQFFNGGIALHGTSEPYYKQLGSRASGGCVRLTLENAEMMWNLVEEVGVEQTRVTVFDSSL